MNAGDRWPFVLRALAGGAASGRRRLRPPRHDEVQPVFVGTAIRELVPPSAGVAAPDEVVVEQPVPSFEPHVAAAAGSDTTLHDRHRQADCPPT